MSYNIKFEKPITNEEQDNTWENKPPNLELPNKTIKEVQMMGGSQKYGHGGRFTPDGGYIAINGHKSRGGQPLKLRCKDGDIPISPTDFINLSTITAKMPDGE